MAVGTPLRETIRQQRLALSVLNEQLGNGEQANSTTNITAIIAALTVIQGQIAGASSGANLTTIS